MGHFLVNDRLGHLKNCAGAVEVLQCCEVCLEQVEKEDTELGNCTFVCQECTSTGQLCQRCKALGFSMPGPVEVYHQAALKVRSSKRIVVCALASDCLEKQKKIIRQLEEQRFSQEAEQAALVDKSSGQILILRIPSPDDPHTDKNIVAEYDNYWQMKNGEAFSTIIGSSFAFAFR